ncbi:MAG: chemotaxis response regulator protein-glutamate methylesterase [Inquilinus sp.]|nr:chemotaxis response regulator protein-glutamate methylesterase [Inquilinus sp.]
MLVEDSAVIRGFIGRALEADPGVIIVASVADGQMAVDAIQRAAPDVVVLDIEMPVMDGLTALPKLLAASPRSNVIMASTLTKRNADISLRALSAGAADYIAKPSSAGDLAGADDFKVELLRKVKALAAAARGRDGAAPARDAGPASPAARPAGVTTLYPGARITTRPMPAVFNPRVIAVGSSTGGPQALMEVLAHLRGVRQPVLVTQHMPATFTTILAEHITRQAGLPTVEGADGMPLQAGRCHLAPGGFHMTIEAGAPQPVIRLNEGPLINYVRPAVDPMMESIVEVYRSGILSVILTGMGKDGLDGCRATADAGGVVIAQDEASSVVWGMPGAVATDGIANAILPLRKIGPTLRDLAIRTAA